MPNTEKHLRNWTVSYVQKEQKLTNHWMKISVRKITSEQLMSWQQNSKGLMNSKIIIPLIKIFRPQLNLKLSLLSRNRLRKRNLTGKLSKRKVYQEYSTDSLINKQVKYFTKPETHSLIWRVCFYTTFTPYDIDVRLFFIQKPSAGANSFPMT